MNKKVFLLVFNILSIAALFAHQPTNSVDYNVVPLPQNISIVKGNGFELNNNTKIIYKKGNNIQRKSADFLAEYIKVSTGLDLRVTDIEELSNVIVLKTEYKGKRPESYNLIIDNKRVIINGTDEAGVFYGIQTLRKSLPITNHNSIILLPAVDIKDYPRFQYRGMHLDVSRHMFPIEFIKKYIDILALHNMNRFHWHLTDDQGWRIEIKKYPELTKIGSQRAQTVIGRNSGEYDNKPYGGFYTQKEIKDIVNYANERFITIVPEVDLPGHMLAVLASYPNLGCTGGPYKVSENWGIFSDVLCAGNEDIYPFLEDVFDEVIELFPSEYIHIGGDECLKDKWEVCPKCQAKIKELGLKSDNNYTAEQKLQSYVMHRVEEYIKSKGRKIIGWDEILEGDVSPSATIMSWRGVQAGITAAKQNHDVIMTPTVYLYFDYYQTKDTEDEPYAIGGFVPVEKVYSFEPISEELTPEQQKRIIGVQANLWAEFISDSKHVEYMVLPRMGALSEVQWTMPEKKDYKSFMSRLFNQIKLYKHLGYNFATHVFDVQSEIKANANTKQIEVTLFTIDDTSIYYTVDGTEPSSKSERYDKTLLFNKSVVLKAIAIRDDGRSKIFRKEFDINKATFKNVMLENDPTPRHTYGGKSLLVDGISGTHVYSSGEWIGFTKDFIAVIDLEKVIEILSVDINVFIDVVNWIGGATDYTIYLSEDNKIFRKVFDEKYPPLEKEKSKAQKRLHASFPVEKARYVKIVAKSLKSLPEWSSGKSKPASIFVDEIKIY